MKKSLLFEIISGLILIVIFLLAINSITTTQLKTNAQVTISPSQGIELLKTRLIQMGVPIKQIDVRNVSPL